jgi:predicted Ser/Thr protein kinase
VRALWIAIALLVLMLVAGGLPLRYEMVRTGHPNLRVPEFSDLIPAGVNPDVAATLDLATGMFVFLALLIGGVTLFLRASTSAEASFLSLVLILYGAAFTGLIGVHRAAGPPFSQPAVGLAATVLLFVQTTTVWAALFWLPEGRFMSRWTAGFTALLVPAAAVIYFLVDFPLSHYFVNLLAVPVVAVAACAQVIRYRQLVDPVTRQQIKWAVIGIVAGCVGFLEFQIATLVLGERTELTPRIVMVAALLLEYAALVWLLVCFAIAIRRFRLWQVDLFINRSLVYGVVTAMLVLVFLGGGFVVQGVIGRENSSLAFAISIAAAGLLFNPARKQVQSFVDRRLYGFRFDLIELQRAQHLLEVENPGMLTGRRVGEYRLLGVLGKGGMGEVYQGERDGRTVAIKILPEALTRERDFRKWFERESHALAAFSHPNIVKFHEAGESRGLCYIVLDFVEGRELSDIIRERGRIPIEEVRAFVGDFAAALDYAHEKGLVHRDIKPANIMIRRVAGRETWEPVLMDFGIAKMADARTALTSTGAVGTIGYMSPEQIMAAATIDHRADIYALGAMVYEMLTGEPPFTGSPAQVLFAHLQRRPTDPGELVPGLPPSVASSVMRALEKDPQDRFQSAGAFALALS